LSKSQAGVHWIVSDPCPKSAADTFREAPWTADDRVGHLSNVRIRAVWADAAYFNYAFLGFVRDILHASVNVDYNLRRQGKRFLATLFFVRQWRDLMSPRTNIECHLAWLKRYFGLKYFRVQGYFAVIQFVFRVCIATLIVAFIAARHQRPELATSCLQVLAFVNT
jgi:hypothetical protein